MSCDEVLRNGKVRMPLGHWNLRPLNRPVRRKTSRAEAIRQVAKWSLDRLDRQESLIRTYTRLQGTRYPIKLLRYWFMYHLLVAEAKRLGRPLRVCEIGVDRGQMRHFASHAGLSEVECWDAVDVKPRRELHDVGYDEIYKLNAEDPDFRLDQRYDVIIALNLLEHLHEPEAALARFSGALVPGGIVIVGYPVTLKLFQNFWQSRLRKTARPFHHVSVFSPDRTIKMAAINGLKLDFLSGAFLMRRSGSCLENYRWWARLNLLFGAAFPSLGGELYWSMRKG